MSTRKPTTLRLNMPQWQGGNLPDYYLGSELLSWLAPPASGPVATVPVPEPKPGQTLAVENGILGREALLRQARAARAAIEKHRPDRIVTLGGDCLVDLAPIAYLNSDQYDDRGQAPKTIDFACCEALNASWTRHGFAPTFTPA